MLQIRPVSDSRNNKADRIALESDARMSHEEVFGELRREDKCSVKSTDCVICRF